MKRGVQIERHKLRRAFSLVEMVSALTASALLLLTLASSVAISVSVVEPDESRLQRWRDQSIRDRLQDDLRYATSIDSLVTGNLNLTRPDSTGALQSVQYDSASAGLTRQRSGQPMVTLDQDTPVVSYQVDGYSAPTASSAAIRPRLRDQAVAATEDGANQTSLDVAVPDGARSGDLLLLVAAYQTSDSLTVDQPGWMTGSAASNADLSVVCWWRILDGSTALTQTLQMAAGDKVAVAVLAIEHSDPADPIGWYGYRIGVSTLGDTATYPGVIDIQAGTEAKSLVFQCIAMTSSVADEASLGVTAFTDCARAVAAPGTSVPTLLGVIARTGPLPSMTSVPRVDPLQASSWVNVAVEVESVDE